MFEQYENSILQLHFLSAIGKPVNVLNLYNQYLTENVSIL